MTAATGKLVSGLILAAAVVVAAYLAVDTYKARSRAHVANPNMDPLGEEFQFDLTEYRKTDANLIAYRQVAAIATGLAEPRGVAADRQGRVYVAGDHAVRVFDPNGTFLTQLAADSPPRCVAVAPDGTIVLGMKDHFESPGTMENWPAAGRTTRRSDSLGPRAIITSVAATGSDVFVADFGDRVVVRCDPNGREILRIGRKDPARNIPGLSLPSPHFDVAMGNDTLLRVTNPGRRQVEAYTIEGDLEASWGTSGMGIAAFCGCCNPTDLAVLPDGKIVTSEKGLPRVKVYDANGKFLCVVAGAEAFSPDAAGLDLAADPQGRILVLDGIARTVRVFERNQP